MDTERLIFAGWNFEGLRTESLQVLWTKDFGLVVRAIGEWNKKGSPHGRLLREKVIRA